MITRIYRVRINPAERAAFEPLFQTVALASVADQPGCVSVTVGGPTPPSSNEYAMMTVWESAAALEAFIGPDWSQAHIPDGMEHFIDECWVHHYAHMD